ncbi:hypothetical protein BJY04DRAFT_27709 [Aspergillus karnatakaensis]|uniref:uncharacterized protein n=1 Tax=Aspergillus karnatakaensis TaxID=1810916 RepID=UPI003CCCE82B
MELRKRRRRHEPTAENSVAGPRRTRASAAQLKDRKNLFAVIYRRDQHFRFLDLPFEIRQLIYRFALGYRAIHIVHGLREDIRVLWQRSKPPGHRWQYFICKCDVASSERYSEYATAQAWNEGSIVRIREKNSLDPRARTLTWRKFIPACRFLDTNHVGVEGDSHTAWAEAPREKLDLSLLRANRQVYNEARDVPYTSSIFAFSDVDSFRWFVSSRTGLPPAKLALIRNLSICAMPKARGGAPWWRIGDASRWSKWLFRTPATLEGLSGLKRLQVVIKNPREDPCDWTDDPPRWTNLVWMFGFLAFAKLSIPEVAVNVDLCRSEWSESVAEDEKACRAWEAEMQRAKVTYAELLESKLRAPWSEIEPEMKRLEKQYVDITGDHGRDFDWD